VVNLLDKAKVKFEDLKEDAKNFMNKQKVVSLQIKLK
jgi:hypothetical protein